MNFTLDQGVESTCGWQIGGYSNIVLIRSLDMYSDSAVNVTMETVNASSGKSCIDEATIIIIPMWKVIVFIPCIVCWIETLQLLFFNKQSHTMCNFSNNLYQFAVQVQLELFYLAS